MTDNIINNWLKSAAAGDERGWNALYQRFYPGMYAIALRICRDKELASDAVQESFVTCYLKLSQLKDTNRFGAWLRQIVTRTCYRSLSGKNRHVSLEGDSPEGEHLQDDALNRKIDSLAKESKLTGIVAALPEVLNITLLLRYFSNFQTYDEIAAILHIPVGTVRSRLNEAKRKIAAHWRQLEDVSNDRVRESEEWNAFYYSICCGMHANDSCKNKFVDHILSGSMMAANGKQHPCGEVIEHMVEDDRQAGSWLEPVNIYSSGNISIIESIHYNSTDHPGHCPASSVMILCREKGRVSRLFLHAFEK